MVFEKNFSLANILTSLIPTNVSDIVSNISFEAEILLLATPFNILSVLRKNNKVKIIKVAKEIDDTIGS